MVMFYPCLHSPAGAKDNHRLAASPSRQTQLPMSSSQHQQLPLSQRSGPPPSPARPPLQLTRTLQQQQQQQQQQQAQGSEHPGRALPMTVSSSSSRAKASKPAATAKAAKKLPPCPSSAAAGCEGGGALWYDKYAPADTSALAVHRKKCTGKRICVNSAQAAVSTVNSTQAAVPTACRLLCQQRTGCCVNSTQAAVSTACRLLCQQRAGCCVNSTQAASALTEVTFPATRLPAEPEQPPAQSPGQSPQAWSNTKPCPGTTRPGQLQYHRNLWKFSSPQYPYPSNADSSDSDIAQKLHACSLRTRDGPMLA
eukprot:1160611-Pelagomonas_calceolata.AAC.4